MPKGDTVNTEDGEIDKINRELEEFKNFFLMNKPLENGPKVAVKGNLKDLAFKFKVQHTFRLKAFLASIIIRNSHIAILSVKGSFMW